MARGQEVRGERVPRGPEVAEEYPSVVYLVHRVRYLEQRVTSSESRPRKLAVELAKLRACLDAPFEKRNGPLFISGFKHKQDVDAVLSFCERDILGTPADAPRH